MTRRGPFDRSILSDVAHRPWPVPRSAWVLTQTWHDLLFAHWPVTPDALVPLVPPRFELDLFEGTAFIAVVPFYMSNVGIRGVPPLPGVSRFPELNVRTYVRVDDKPGVYFFSLDAASALAVATARTALNLPYHRAAMSLREQDGEIHYRSARRRDPSVEFRARYRPVGQAFHPREGSLAHFLTERYCLYNVDLRGRPYRLDIHHPRWTLQAAECAIAQNTMARASGVTVVGPPPLLHFSRRQDVVAWMPVQLDTSNSNFVTRAGSSIAPPRA